MWWLSTQEVERLPAAATAQDRQQQRCQQLHIGEAEAKWAGCDELWVGMAAYRTNPDCSQSLLLNAWTVRYCISTIRC